LAFVYLKDQLPVLILSGSFHSKRLLVTCPFMWVGQAVLPLVPGGYFRAVSV
jgi:hypothetical protein